ncbi:MAG: hypothetical protein E6767_01960 [Dysgonomonas sp.]|nr:hypothetical protein [Dysgonomonas sp.]
MKILTPYSIITLFAISLFSCSDDIVKLYHEQGEIEYYWLLEKVEYPATKYGLIDRKDIQFSYTDDETVSRINNINGDLIAVNQVDNQSIAYSKIRNLGSLKYYDTIFVTINNNDLATEAYHVIYRENVSTEEKELEQKDLTTFTYNTTGHLAKIERYENADPAVAPTYWEEYTYTNNNLTKINTSLGYQYNYTYDNLEHNPISGYCYEMPFNTYSISQGECWLLSNMVFISDYLGEKSQNNIKNITVTHSSAGGDNVTITNITYNYTFDEDNILIGAEYSGVVNSQQLPSGQITRFTYQKKEKI